MPATQSRYLNPFGRYNGSKNLPKLVCLASRICYLSFGNKGTCRRASLAKVNISVLFRDTNFLPFFVKFYDLKGLEFMEKRDRWFCFTSHYSLLYSQFFASHNHITAFPRLFSVFFSVILL